MQLYKNIAINSNILLYFNVNYGIILQYNKGVMDIGNKSDTFGYDKKEAVHTLDGFAMISGIHCELYDGEKGCIHSTGPLKSGCDFCKKYCKMSGADFECDNLNKYAVYQAERFGGRYIYTCPAGMVFFASPITSSRKETSAFICGPVSISDGDELQNGVFDLSLLTTAQEDEVKGLFCSVPRKDPKLINCLSEQLFREAVFVGDSTREAMASHHAADRNKAIGEYIYMLKDEDKTDYPIEKETELFDSIAEGNSEKASKLLNEILGAVFFSNTDMNKIRSRISELLVILSRAAIAGGADSAMILEISSNQNNEMRVINSREKLTEWLAEILAKYTGLVFDVTGHIHSAAVRSAVNYMKQNYSYPLTLEQIADRVGYTRTYFSRTFKKEMGCGFSDYLNKLRIDKSKELLINDDIPTAEISGIVGFCDQSYFCKVFRGITGMTPDKYKKHQRRIDVSMEYGFKSQKL